MSRIGYVATAIYKFQGEQHDKWHPKKLIWPGVDGIPLLEPDEPVPEVIDTSNVFMSHYFHSRMFDLSNAEDVAYYHWVSDRIVGGWFVPLEKRFIEDGKKVYLEWVQRYLQVLPKKAADRRPFTVLHSNPKPLDLLRM
ncbi:MAG: hypothetical protein KatS3mg087_0007 [Patescibacteria group bacterium]|nr:MAG: hypothetical protein KatS3mg087_0007 [Patescibacteria group bacterium]